MLFIIKINYLQKIMIYTLEDLHLFSFKTPILHLLTFQTPIL
jgi:hypothetical protein